MELAHPDILRCFWGFVFLIYVFWGGDFPSGSTRQIVGSACIDSKLCGYLRYSGTVAAQPCSSKQFAAGLPVQATRGQGVSTQFTKPWF